MEPVPVSDHEEYDARVEQVVPWGVVVDLGDGRGTALVDNTKVPAWRADEPMPEVGGALHVVVLDADRSPPRVSALPVDWEIARRLRG